MRSHFKLWIIVGAHTLAIFCNMYSYVCVCLCQSVNFQRVSKKPCHPCWNSDRAPVGRFLKLSLHQMHQYASYIQTENGRCFSCRYPAKVLLEHPSPSIGRGWVTWTPSWLAWNSWMMTLFMRRFGSAWNKARMGSNRFMTAQKSNAMHALLVSWVRLLVSLVLHSISQMFEWFGQCLIFETA